MVQNPPAEGQAYYFCRTGTLQQRAGLIDVSFNIPVRDGVVLQWHAVIRLEQPAGVAE